MTLDYGNYGIFLFMGTAGFMSSSVVAVCMSRGVDKDSRSIEAVNPKPQTSNPTLTRNNLPFEGLLEGNHNREA